MGSQGSFKSFLTKKQSLVRFSRIVRATQSGHGDSKKCLRALSQYLGRGSSGGDGHDEIRQEGDGHSGEEVKAAARSPAAGTDRTQTGMPRSLVWQHVVDLIHFKDLTPSRGNGI